MPVWQTPPYPGDLSQALIVRFSQGVAQSGNIIQASSPLLTPVTFTPPSASLMGAGSGGAFTVSTAVPGFSWMATSQDSWLNILGSSSGTGSGGVQYAADPNPTGAPRTGTITVAGVVFSLVQSPMNGLPVASAAGVANAASYAAGTVAPGEVVTIFGSNFGPATLAGATLVNGSVSTQIATTQVLFDGVPTPMIYAAANQVSAIVPYAVHGGSTQMVVSYNSAASLPVTLNIAPSAPGLFTADGTGSGQGAFLNTNWYVNSTSNPAAKGSIVTLFGTGEGLTNPAGVEGRLAAAPYAAPILPVVLTVGAVASKPVTLALR